ncbi:hypothetical protein Tco_0047855 [Tanacetum coccineum]
MTGRVWDVNAVTGRYLSTDFVVSDSKVEPAHNKYLIDIARYVTNVGRTSYTKSGSKTLEFYLANQRVTLWGELCDVLVEKKIKHVGVCAIVLIGMSGKEYNNKLYLSNTSSMVFYDDDDIPCLQELRADDWVMIENFRTKKSARKVLRERIGNGSVRHVTGLLTILFLGTRPSLKCTAESLMGMEDEGSDADDDLNLPLAIRNLIGTIHVLEIKSHTYYEYGTFESFNYWKINLSKTAEDDASSSTPAVTANDAELLMKIVTKPPTVCTPLKPNDERNIRELEDSDVEEVCGPLANKGKSSADVAMDTKKKRKRYTDHRNRPA